MLDIFDNIVTLSAFIHSHGLVTNEEWRHRRVDNILFRILTFDGGVCAITVHQLDSLPVIELVAISDSLKVGYFREGGYVVYRNWVNPSEWESIDISGVFEKGGALDSPAQELSEIDWSSCQDNHFEHPFHSSAIRTVPFKDFLDGCVTMYKDMGTCFGKNGLEQWPVLVFIDYNDHKDTIFNPMELSYFEILKFTDYLYIEGKTSGISVLRGKMPEGFIGDRAILERWKDFAEASEKRRIERGNTGWIPEVEIGR